jgi:hypothetical protein
MPLSSEEREILRSLSEALERDRRIEFMAEATRRLEAAPAIGPGTAHQVGRIVQRNFRDPPLDMRRGRIGPRN